MGRSARVLFALLAVALLVPASALAQRPTISVSGDATQQVPNDTAGLGFSVTKVRGTRSAALSAASERLRAVIAAVQTVPGVGPGDVTTGRISAGRVVRDKHVLYRASEGISVVLHQPDQAGNLINAAIEAGATGTRGPSFFVGDTDLAYNQALAVAFAAAKAKAAALAAEAGRSLGPVISIVEGGITNYSPSSATKGGPRGAPPVKSAATTVTATVQVVFEIL